MKKIHIILPVHNQQMLNIADLAPYQSEECEFVLSYADTDLIELNTISDVQAVIPSVLERIKEAKNSNPLAIILYAFGDVAISKANEHDEIPIIGLGRLVIRLSNEMCSRKFTVIPAQMAHVPFIQALVSEEILTLKYQVATKSPGMNPSDLRKNPSETLNCLYDIIVHEFTQNNIDTFTFGCGSFFGVEKQLRKMLQKTYSDEINIIGLFDGIADFVKKI